MEREEENRAESKANTETKAEYSQGKSNHGEEKMSKHIETRKQVKEIADISSFNSLINSTTLSDTDKQILVLHYIDDKDFKYIGDMLGFSESTIKRRHKKALQKISKML